MEKVDAVGRLHDAGYTLLGDEERVVFIRETMKLLDELDDDVEGFGIKGAVSRMRNRWQDEESYMKTKGKVSDMKADNAKMEREVEKQWKRLKFDDNYKNRSKKNFDYGFKITLTSAKRLLKKEIRRLEKL